MKPTARLQRRPSTTRRGGMHFWNELPPSSASDEDWSAFKHRAFDHFCELIREADREFKHDPRTRIERIRQFRRAHHLIVIADRIRRSPGTPSGLSEEELRDAAAFVIDRRCYGKEGRLMPRSRLEEKMISSARVSWHKIMRRAESPACLFGGRGSGRPALRRGTQIFRKITAPGLTPETRAELLRAYIEDRVQQLVDLAGEFTATTNCKLPEPDRILVQDLESILQQAKRQKPDVERA